MRLTVGDTIYVQGGPERPATPIGAQRIIGYVIVAVILECALHHRASHRRTATARSLSNLVDLLAAPV